MNKEEENKLKKIYNKLEDIKEYIEITYPEQQQEVLTTIINYFEIMRTKK